MGSPWSGSRTLALPSLVLTLVVATAGCASAPVTSSNAVTPVPLRTSELGTGTVGCYPSSTEGELKADPARGTVIGSTLIVWPKGYTGRRSGAEIEVLDASGAVVARTGTKVRLAGGNEGSDFIVCAAPAPKTID